MTKHIAIAHLDPYLTQFNQLYSSVSNSKDFSTLQKSANELMTLQRKITDEFDNAPVSIAYYLKWSKTPTTDLATLNTDLESKVQTIVSRCVQFASSPAKTPPPPSNNNNTSSTKPVNKPQKIAVGFIRNVGEANCWINSLLSMVVFIPSLRQAYKYVADHYANTPGPDQVHGQALEAALDTYDIALAGEVPVSASVTQKVRLAFNHFFGSIAKDHLRQEDAQEALQLLMGRYEMLLKSKGQFSPPPSPYFVLNTTKQLQPVGDPFAADPTKLKEYSKLADVTSTPTDYQIFIDLKNRTAPLAQFFKNTTGFDLATYLRTDGQLQMFQPTSETHQFITTPDEFMLALKRFTREGKVSDSVPEIKRTITLPNDAIQDGTIATYKLDAFIVHEGATTNSGHYICYKEIDGKWIEADDGRVRFVEEVEIDGILLGQKKHATSYLHHYKKFSVAPKQPTSTPPPSPQPKIEPPVQNFDSNNMPKEAQALQWLEKCASLFQQQTVNIDGIKQALTEIEKTSADAIEGFRFAIWLNDKTPNTADYGTTTLAAQPKKLVEIKTPWLCAGEQNLLGQMIAIQKVKGCIAEQKLFLSKLQDFLTKFNDPKVTDDELRKMLPEELQWKIHGLLYHTHKKQFGEAHVHDSKYNSQYGKVTWETGKLREILTADVLNFELEKLQCTYEKMQLQGFHNLLQQKTPERFTNKQLLKAYERLELRPQLRKELEELICKGNSVNITNTGFAKQMFNDNPRCVLNIKDVAADNILLQVIANLDTAAK